MEDEYDDTVLAEIEDISQFGPKTDYCRGNGECKLFRNRITNEIICGVCDTMFTDDEEDGSSQTEDEQFIRPPLSSMFDEDQLREKSVAESKLEAMDERLEILDTKLDIIIEFLQKNVTLESKPLELPIPEQEPVKQAIKVSKDEVKAFVALSLSDLESIGVRDTEVQCDLIRATVNGKFKTRFKNKGIENLIKEIKDARGS